MVSAVFDGDEIEIRDVTSRSQRHFSFSLAGAVALHLLLAVVWMGVEASRAAPQPLLPEQPLIHATLVAVPEPMQMEQRVAPSAPQRTMQSPSVARTTPVQSQPQTSSATVTSPQPSSVVDQATQFNEPSTQPMNYAVASQQKDVGMVQESYTPPSSEIAYGHNPKPNYPLAAKRRGMEGVVELMVLVDEKGAPVTVDVKHSSGFTVLDREALKAVAQWRFEPARRGGMAVAGEVVVPVRFQLEML